VKFQDNGSDQVVQAGAKPAAHHQGAFELAGIEEDVAPRTGLLVRGGYWPFGSLEAGAVDIDVYEDAVLVGHETDAVRPLPAFADRTWDAALAEGGDEGVGWFGMHAQSLAGLGEKSSEKIIDKLCFMS
jgi:hypothetical protein